MLNPIECYSTEKFNYLLIHKNGCSTVVNNIKNNYKFSCNNIINSDKPSFTVIRDPWARTISGLTYDLQKTFGTVTEEIIESIDFERLLFQTNTLEQRSTGFISHIAIQASYLFNANLTFYVLLEDLDHFLSLHFSKVYSIKNESDRKLKNKLLSILANRPDLTDLIQKYLAVDYHLIEDIKYTKSIWNFSKGRMWT